MIKKSRESMKNKWKVGTQLIGTRQIYQAYRLIDPRGKNTAENREYNGPIYAERIGAKHWADRLNEVEE